MIREEESVGEKFKFVLQFMHNLVALTFFFFTATCTWIVLDLLERCKKFCRCASDGVWAEQSMLLLSQNRVEHFICMCSHAGWERGSYCDL